MEALEASDVVIVDLMDPVPVVLLRPRSLYKDHWNSGSLPRIKQPRPMFVSLSWAYTYLDDYGLVYLD